MAGRHSRNKGARIEREIVKLHDEAGIPCEKVSRTGYEGEDLRIADEFTGESKGRASGKGFTTLDSWLGDNALLFLRKDRARPNVYMTWDMYVALMRGYLR